MYDYKNFSECLKAHRSLAQKTQKDVANYLGLTYQSYQAYELGASYPSFRNLVKLADYFDVSMDELIGREHY